ncbi:MAG TPA: hypothetical protein VMZ53_22480 [Kofleriaceae bacterium]|nr:hypothetical protein [Kofleriaceae bacterium]
MRSVKGSLFLDYVRMLKAHKGVEWSAFLSPEDLAYLSMTIDKTAWYPMESFERMGNAILKFVAGGELMPVQLWGRYSSAQMKHAHPKLLAPGDPVETLNRFKVMRSTFFDFEALQVLMLHDGEAQISIAYHMGMPAEEAASVQTMGFFEGLLELAGAKEIRAKFREKSWAGDARTVLDIRWVSPLSR